MSEVQVGDPHEPSYYEIALTNRQVLVAFVILLVCVVGAFFAGVWVGRGGAPRQAGTTAASQVAQANPSGQPLQELQFFSGKPSQPAPATQPESQPAASAPSTAAAPSAAVTPPAAAAPNQSLAADLSVKPEVTTAAPAGKGEALSPVPQPPPGSDTEPNAPAAPATHATTPATVAANGAKPKSPSPVPTGSTTAAASSTPAAGSAASAATSSTIAAGKAPELTAGEMVVQVFSSADGEQAKKTLARVNKGGYKAYLSPLLVGKQTMYRVRIGPFTDRAQAQKIADQVRKKFRLDTWITR